MVKKIGILTIGLVTALSLGTTAIFAHAVVKPNTVGIGSFTDFSLGVPAEKNANTTSVRLMLPPGLGSISPVVKPGWQVQIKNGPVPAGVSVQPDDDGNLPATIPTEIDWTSGSIPSGQKDYFQFSAQVPSKETELDWKVTQIYSDGSTVSWSLGPSDPQPKDSAGKTDTSKFGPYSKTMVINDLKPSANPTTTQSVTGVENNGRSTIFSLVASGLSAAALGLSLVNRRRPTA